MATPNCWRCLQRPSVTAALASPRRVPAIALANTKLPVVLSAASPFSSTAAAYGDPREGVPGSKGKKRFQAKKSFTRSTGKSPLPGERKAFRKRIQLSNNNALAVAGLEALSVERMLDPSSVARMMSLPDTLVDQLRAVEAFKPTQTWGFFREPHTLVRAETVELSRRMQKAAASREVLRLVLTGDRISGKSTLLLQAMANAYLNNWIVLSFPEAQELTTACTEYALIPGTEPTQYMQPVYALNMLRQLRKASENVLKTMTVLNKHDNVAADVVPHSSSLWELVAMVKEPDHAWIVLEALWKELATPGPDRRPVLVALDGLSHIMKVSDYRSPAFELIHSHDLAIVRRFVDAISGTGTGTSGPTKFPAGGAVIAATSRGNAPKSFSMELAIARREAEKLGKPAPVADPYLRAYDSRVEEALKSVDVMRVGGLDHAESRALMEYWAASGVMRHAVDQKKVVDIMALGGNGIVGEMERAALLTMRL